MAHTLVMEDFISHNVAVLELHDPGNKLAFAVDEWGTWYDTEPGRESGFLFQQNTLRDAVVAAVNLNIFHRHADRVRLANIAQMVNVLQSMILTDGPKMVLTPTYHVFSMFKPFQDATSLATEIQTPNYNLGAMSVPALSLSAARSGTGAIIVALVNLDPHRTLNVSSELTGFSARKVSGAILSAAEMDARNSFEAPHVVEPKTFADAHLARGHLTVSLPAKSVVVLNLQ
jgi:alpha-N-arabinofuranosidase